MLAVKGEWSQLRARRYLCFGLSAAYRAEKKPVFSNFCVHVQNHSPCGRNGRGRTSTLSVISRAHRLLCYVPIFHLPSIVHPASRDPGKGQHSGSIWQSTTACIRRQQPPPRHTAPFFLFRQGPFKNTPPLFPAPRPYIFQLIPPCQVLFIATEKYAPVICAKATPCFFYPRTQHSGSSNAAPDLLLSRTHRFIYYNIIIYIFNLKYNLTHKQKVIYYL